MDHGRNAYALLDQSSGSVLLQLLQKPTELGFRSGDTHNHRQLCAREDQKCGIDHIGTRVFARWSKHDCKYNKNYMMPGKRKGVSSDDQQLLELIKAA